MANLTLLDVAKLNTGTEVVPLIESVLDENPEIRVFPALSVSGTDFDTVQRTVLPTTDFRAVNDGFTTAKSEYQLTKHQMFLAGGAIQFDKAIPMAAKMSMAEFEMLEAKGVMKDAARMIGKQIWYGTSNKTLGFPGAKAFVPTTSSLAVDATGSSATTGSNVYMVRFGDDGARLVFGASTTFSMDPFFDQALFTTAGKQYAGRVSNLTAWVGLQLASQYCVGRIYNCTEDSGKGCTDALIAKLWARFPVGAKPNAIFMSRRSHYQLWLSRTITVNTNGNTKIGGTNLNQPNEPDNWSGIPIYVSDSILDTDVIGT